MTHIAWNGDGGFAEYSYSSVVEGEPAEVLDTQADTAEERADERAMATGEASVTTEALAAQVVKLTMWESSLVALGALVLFYGVALGSLYAIGSIAHAIDPSRRFDLLYVLHNEIVVLVLIAITVLWLVPPYPAVISTMERSTKRRSGTKGTKADEGEPQDVPLGSSEWSGMHADPSEVRGGMPPEHT